MLGHTTSGKSRLGLVKSGLIRIGHVTTCNDRSGQVRTGEACHLTIGQG
jgi:hypothetical protein